MNSKCTSFTLIVIGLKSAQIMNVNLMLEHRPVCVCVCVCVCE